MIIELEPEDRARLKAARDRFLAELSGLTPQQQKLRARRLANTAVGFGPGKVDPMVAAYARQMVDVMDSNDRIEALQAEIRQIDATDLSGYRPKDPTFKGRTLARRAQLEEQIKHTMVRGINAAESDLAREQRDATKLYRAEEKRQSKVEALREAVARQAAEQEKADIEARAAAIVRAQRFAGGGNDGVEV